MKKLTLLVLTLLIIGCAPITSVKTNLDPENFTNYFAPFKVKIYNSIKELPKERQLIGLVEGDDCQQKPHLAAPDQIKAKNMARRQAAELKANAVIFSQCIAVENKACHASIVCYAQAYQVIE